MPPKKSVRRKEPDQLSVREMLGLSQAEMAEFCGVSKSTYSMIELDLRSWPIGASSNHTWLVDSFYEAEQNPPDLSELEIPKGRQLEAWQQEIDGLRYDIGTCKRKIKDLTFRFGQAKRLYQTCLALRKYFPDPDQIENLALNYWMSSAEETMRENGQFERERLQLKIESAQKQVDLLLNWIARSPAS